MISLDVHVRPSVLKCAYADAPVIELAALQVAPSTKLSRSMVDLKSTILLMHELIFRAGVKA